MGGQSIFAFDRATGRLTLRAIAPHPESPDVISPIAVAGDAAYSTLTKGTWSFRIP